MVLELQSERLQRGYDSATMPIRSGRTVCGSTEAALKEHFIFERIAEDQKIEADRRITTTEIRLIADQTGESARRVRARLEKRGRWTPCGTRSSSGRWSS